MIPVERRSLYGAEFYSKLQGRDRDTITGESPQLWCPECGHIVIGPQGATSLNHY